MIVKEVVEWLMGIYSTKEEEFTVYTASRPGAIYVARRTDFFISYMKVVMLSSLPASRVTPILILKLYVSKMHDYENP